MDARICEWLMENADTPIRYRIAREFFQDIEESKRLQTELLEHPAVIEWLGYLKPDTPPKHWSMEHGSMNYCLENAGVKIAQLGLHSGIPQVRDAVQYYFDKMKNGEAMDSYFAYSKNQEIYYRKGQHFNAIVITNILSALGVREEEIETYLLGSLEEISQFVKEGDYAIYLEEQERCNLKRVPSVWKNTAYFIKPSLTQRYGVGYPMIYDLVGLSRLYDLHDNAVDRKIDDIIEYISTDEFHKSIIDGYGILAEEDGKYHSMGWDPKYPGWFDLDQYRKEKDGAKLLFFAQTIVNYPKARKTKWFNELLVLLESYRTDSGTYIFPKEWLRETKGYAVLGNHLSFGENRRKKNWIELESTFYMQVLKKKCDNFSR